MPRSIQEVIDEASQWLDIEGVEGVAQGQKDGLDCIQVLVSCRVEDLKQCIPTEFQGYPVVVQDETGKIIAL